MEEQQSNIETNSDILESRKLLQFSYQKINRSELLQKILIIFIFEFRLWS